MRIFSYRNKRTLRRIALIALLAAVLLGLLILARISYLGRYVVYSQDGVYFDKTQKLQRTPPVVFAVAAKTNFCLLITLLLHLIFLLLFNICVQFVYGCFSFAFRQTKDAML